MNKSVGINFPSHVILLDMLDSDPVPCLRVTLLDKATGRSYQNSGHLDDHPESVLKVAEFNIGRIKAIAPDLESDQSGWNAIEQQIGYAIEFLLK